MASITTSMRTASAPRGRCQCRPTKSAAKKPLRILMFGGSTMWGVDVRDEGDDSELPRTRADEPRDQG